MRLVCPSCGSQYDVDVSLFPEEGREVQCSNCENVWVQYPVAEEPPMRLDAVAREEDAPRPSERISDRERESIAASVSEEIEMRRSFADEQEDEDDDDEAILAALREQIKAEGGPVDSGGPALSQKRNLRVAAESVGVNVDAQEDDSSRRKWNLEERATSEAAASSGRRDGLKAALARYEEEVGPRRARGGGLKKGFLAALILVGIGVGVHQFQGEIVEAYPPAEPYLEQFNGYVAQGRLQAETLYAQYAPMVMEKVSELTAGGDETAAE